MANAIRLDADVDRLDTETVVPAGASWTSCGWIKIVTDLNDETPVFTIEATYGYPYIALRTDTDGVTPTCKLTWMSRASLGALTVGEWYFVAIRVKSDLSVSTWVGQAGGSLTRVDDTLGFGYSDPSVRYSIGGGYPGSGYLNGSFSRVRLWNAEISNAEMEAEFSNDVGAARTSGLVGDWFRPDVTLSDYLNDNSSSNNDLTTSGTHALDTSAPDLGPTGSVATSTGTSDAVGVGTYIVAGQAVGSAAGASAVAGVGASRVESVGSAAGAGVAAGVGSAIGLDWSTQMPRISLGKPAYGSGVPGRMVDGGYYYVDDPGAWACTTGSWVAVQVGSGPSQVLVGLSADATGGSCLANAFAAYRLQTSNDSTNGVDGTWTTRVTVTGNGVVTREHLLPFTGESWVKLILDDCAATQLDELDVWDASNGTPDTFALLGDSITDGWSKRITYFGGGNTPSFQTRCQVHRPGHFPLQVNCGATGQGAQFWESNIDAFLAMHSDVKYWLVAIGTNDAASMPAGITSWRSRMTYVLNAIVAAGRIPIIARVTYTGSAAYGGGDYETCGTRYLNDNGVDWLVSTLGVRAGPDLYERFWLNRENFAVVDDAHPNADGQRNIMQAWADVVAPVIGATGVAAGSSSAQGVASGGTSDAVGSSAGTSSAAGMGASIAASVAASAGVGAAAAAGASIAEAAGASAGTSTAIAEGRASVGAVAVSSGSSAAAALGASVASSVASASGASTASAVGAYTTGSAAVAASAGSSTAEAVGSSEAAAVASSAGTSTAVGVGSSTATAIGSSAGTSTALAVGVSAGAGAAVATATGTSTVAAVGARTSDHMVGPGGQLLRLSLRQLKPSQASVSNG